MDTLVYNQTRNRFWDTRKCDRGMWRKKENKIEPGRILWNNWEKPKGGDHLGDLGVERG